MILKGSQRVTGPTDASSLCHAHTSNRKLEIPAQGCLPLIPTCLAWLWKRRASFPPRERSRPRAWHPFWMRAFRRVVDLGP